MALTMLNRIAFGRKVREGASLTLAFGLPLSQCWERESELTDFPVRIYSEQRHYLYQQVRVRSCRYDSRFGSPPRVGVYRAGGEARYTRALSETEEA